ncbi:23147_t:CDS:2, partial [Dentiscutata erythropus]
FQMEEDFPENVSEISQFNKTSGKRKAGETNLRRVLVNKGGHPRDPVWEDFEVGKSDALHCKGEVPDDIRHYYLIQ